MKSKRPVLALLGYAIMIMLYSALAVFTLLTSATLFMIHYNGYEIRDMSAVTLGVIAFATSVICFCLGISQIQQCRKIFD
ncbi:MAG: hypothetical protein PHG25_02110 [Candidatus Pacebacteria bacterium]|nr:hypothetical protein [Candidatus Paceibacterota bacterium]